jgi:hypothetical protein
MDIVDSIIFVGVILSLVIAISTSLIIVSLDKLIDKSYSETASTVFVFTIIFILGLSWVIGSLIYFIINYLTKMLT